MNLEAESKSRKRGPREDEPLRRIHIFMYERDVEDIEALYGSTVGQSKFIRTVVRDYLNKLRQKAREQEQGTKV